MSLRRAASLGSRAAELTCYDYQEPEPVIQLVMRSEDLRLTFDAWGREGDGRAGVRILADALEKE